MTLDYRNIGYTEAVLYDNGSLKCFYKIADMLLNDFRLKFTNKLNDYDSSNWGFKFKGHKLNLHYDIYNGISVFPENTFQANLQENNAVKELGEQLSQKLQIDNSSSIA